MLLDMVQNIKKIYMNLYWRQQNTVSNPESRKILTINQTIAISSTIPLRNPELKL